MYLLLESSEGFSNMQHNMLPATLPDIESEIIMYYFSKKFMFMVSYYSYYIFLAKKIFTIIKFSMSSSAAGSVSCFSTNKFTSFKWVKI